MLRQQINLYQSLTDQASPSTFPTWKQGWLSNLFLFCLFTLMSLYSLWQVNRLEAEKSSLTLQASALATKFNATKSIYPAFFFSADASKGINQLKNEVAMQEKILQTIINQKSFSTTLLALSHIMVPNVWLTKIIILNDNPELIFIGHSLLIDDLRLFLQNFSHEPLFAKFNPNSNSISHAPKNTDPENLSFTIDMVKK